MLANLSNTSCNDSFMVSLSHPHVHFNSTDQLFGYYSTAQDDRKVINIKSKEVSHISV